MKKSVPQEHLLPQVEKAVKNVLVYAATALARPTGLVQRQGKVTGANLAQTLVQRPGFPIPNPALPELAQFGQDTGLDISAEATR